jgi:sulfatase modifying factor 1
VLPRGMKQGLEGKVCNSMASEVTWDRDAAGYRLPTEEEWEYAARAGTRTLYAGGNNLDEVAWYGTFAREGGNSGDATHPVGRKRANAWGLYDMSGNVGEWAWDVHDTGSMRILRGGNFLFDGRVAKRGCDYPGTRGEYAGLRLVRNAD